MMNFESKNILPDKNIDGYLHEKFIILMIRKFYLAQEISQREAFLKI